MAESDLHDIRDLYARHRQGLFTLALSVTRCPARAEDAVHEAFVRLCRAGAAGTGGTGPAADPVAYAFRAVRNAAVDLVRRAPPDPHRVAASSLFNGSVRSPDRIALDDERRQWVEAAIDALPPEQREVVVLRIYAGLNFAQIGTAVGVPLQTAASRYRRALEQLRQQLARLV